MVFIYNKITMILTRKSNEVASIAIFFYPLIDPDLTKCDVKNWTQNKCNSTRFIGIVNEESLLYNEDKDVEIAIDNFRSMTINILYSVKLVFMPVDGIYFTSK